MKKTLIFIFLLTLLVSTNAYSWFNPGTTIIPPNSGTADLITADVSNFDGILSAADTTVQAALETLDDAGSGVYFKEFSIQSAKLTGADITNAAQINAGDRGWSLLFDDTTQEEAVWQYVVAPNYLSGTLTLELLFSMASTQTGDTSVKLDAKICCVTGSIDATDFNSDCYAAEQTSSSGLSTDQTAGYVKKKTITFTAAEADGMDPNDVCRIHLERDPDVASDATGDLELLGLIIHE